MRAEWSALRFGQASARKVVVDLLDNQPFDIDENEEVVAAWQAGAQLVLVVVMRKRYGDA